MRTINCLYVALGVTCIIGIISSGISIYLPCFLYGLGVAMFHFAKRIIKHE